MRCLQPLYRVSTESLQPTTDSLQSPYSLLWTLYRVSTAYYGLSTDSLQPLQTLYRLSTDSLQPLQTLYRLSTDSLQPLQALYSLYRLSTAMLQQCCGSAVQNIKVTTGTAAALLWYHCSKPEFADVLGNTIWKKQWPQPDRNNPSMFDANIFWKYRCSLLFGNECSATIAVGCYNPTSQLACRCNVQLDMADDTNVCQVVVYYLNLFHMYEEIKEMERLQFPTTFEK